MDRESLLNWVSEHAFRERVPLKIEVAKYDVPLSFNEVINLDFEPISVGDSWGTLFQKAWFRLTIDDPSIALTENTVMLIDVGGEGLVVDSSGTSIIGLTNKNSSYGIPPDKPGKWIVPLNGQIHKTYYVDASCNDLFGYVQNGGIVSIAQIAEIQSQWFSTYFDLEVLCDWEKGVNQISNHQPSSVGVGYKRETASITTLLDHVHRLFVDKNQAAINEVKAILKEFYGRRSQMSSLKITSVGHGHLDIAWLWPIEEGRRKARRTFSTALALMDKYDDYIFGASQFQLFEWIQEDDPELFQRIQKRVNEGRFDLQGVFWVECDLNLPSLESLIRQIYYGGQFANKHFNRLIRFVWEPDVFGLTGALPQVLIKSGISVICSQKLSQNRINRFPYHSFVWEGIDGSSVLVHHFPEETYDSRMRADSALKLYNNYVEKDTVPHALMVFGVGDGGGGPSIEHLERYQRIRDIEGLPCIKMGRVEDFILEWSKYVHNMKTVKGELYFERHQGTYTTEALNKIGNESMERLLSYYEFFAALLWRLKGLPIDQVFLDSTWKEVLLYQFHDILPGSSIMRVYHHSRLRYQNLIEDTQFRVMSLAKHLMSMMKETWLIAINPIGYQKNDWVKHEGEWFLVNVPPYSYQVCTHADYLLRDVEDGVIDNGLLRVVINQQGSIESLFDHESGVEYIDAARSGPMWTIYHECAQEYPAWDFEDHYRDGRKAHPNLIARKTYRDGPSLNIELEFHYFTSSITQIITLLPNDRLVSMACEVDWKEINTTLKFSVPITIRSDHARCRLQYGYIDRPTHSQDMLAYAKDEICANLFVDVSNEQRGISLIAPQKYGYRVKDQSLELTVLRSQKKNGSELGMSEQADFKENHYGDLTKHCYTMGFMVHEGVDLQAVNRKAHHVKHPTLFIRNDKQGTDSLQTPFVLSTQQVSIYSVKPAHQHDGIILRLIEESNHDAEVALTAEVKYDSCWLCDLQENPIRQIDPNHITIKALEIVTLKLTSERDMK